MPVPPKNYARPLYWYRKLNQHPDPEMSVFAKEFSKRVAFWLGMETPAIYWFEDADFAQASRAWSACPGPKRSYSADPLREPCEYFRWSGPPNHAFVGYTHRD